MIKEASCLFPIASKGAYFDLPACLANTDKHRHRAGRSQQKFGLPRKFMFGSRHPQSFPPNCRVSKPPLLGSGGAPGAGRKPGRCDHRAELQASYGSLKTPRALHKLPSCMSLGFIPTEHPFQTDRALSVKGQLLPTTKRVS